MGMQQELLRGNSMVQFIEVMKIGDRYYKWKDVQTVLDLRIKHIPEEEIEDLPQ